MFIFRFFFNYTSFTVGSNSCFLKVCRPLSFLACFYYCSHSNLDITPPTSDWFFCILLSPHHQSKILRNGHGVHELSKKDIWKNKWIKSICAGWCLRARVCLCVREAFLMCHALLHWSALWGECFYCPVLTSAACWEHVSPDCLEKICIYVPFSPQITTQTMHTQSVCVCVCVHKKHSDEPWGGQASVILPAWPHSPLSVVHYTADPLPPAANGMQTGYEMHTNFWPGWGRLQVAENS